MAAWKAYRIPAQPGASCWTAPAGAGALERGLRHRRGPDRRASALALTASSRGGVLTAEPGGWDAQADRIGDDGANDTVSTSLVAARTVATVRQAPALRAWSTYGASGRDSSQVSVARAIGACPRAAR